MRIAGDSPLASSSSSTPERPGIDLSARIKSMCRPSSRRICSACVGGFGADQVVIVAENARQRVEVEGIVVDDEQAVAHGTFILYCSCMSRLDVIEKIVDQQPNDPFPGYGLAMEYKNAGHAEEAHATFTELEPAGPSTWPPTSCTATCSPRCTSSPTRARSTQRESSRRARRATATRSAELESALQGLPSDDD